MSAHDPLQAYFLMNSAFYGALDISAFVCGSAFRPKCSHSSTIAHALSKDPQRSRSEPPRITSNVKLHLQFLKRIKEKEASARPSTSYRRKKVEKDLLEDVEEEEKRKFYDSSELIEIEMRRPVLLIDGYNVCGYWSKLKKHFRKGDLDYARQTLLEELVGFSALRGTKVVVVFDAALSGLPDHKEIYQGIDVVFSASTSADTWIEREVELLRKDGCPKVWVVTSDRLHQQCAYGSGAFVWSCKFLVKEIKDAKKESEEILQELRSYSMKGKLLEDNLDPEVRSALKLLKQQLLQADKGG